MSRAPTLQSHCREAADLEALAQLLLLRDLSGPAAVLSPPEAGAEVKNEPQPASLQQAPYQRRPVPGEEVTDDVLAADW